MKLLPVFLLLITASCSPNIRTYSDYDHAYKIQEFKTFGWATDTQKNDKQNPLYYNELNDKRIKNAVNDLLKSKGYIITQTDPSITIDYHIIVEEQSIFEPDPYGYFYGDSYMRQRSNVFSFREGTLILDFKNTQSNELIWRGWAVAAMEVIFYDTRNIDAVIRSAVTKILLALPESNAQSNKGLTLYK